MGPMEVPTTQIAGLEGIFIWLRLGCGKADRWPDFSPFLSAQSPVFIR